MLRSQRKVRIVAVGLAWAVALAMWPMPQATTAALVKVTGVTIKEYAGHLKVVIATSRAARYQQRAVRPDWVVIDVLGAQLGMPQGKLPIAGGPILRVRVGQFTPDIARVVVELIRPVPVRLDSAPDGTAAVVSILSEAAGSLASPQTVAAGPATVTDVTLQDAPQGMKVVITTSRPVQYRLRDVMPDWVVVAVQGAELAPGVRISKPGRGPVTRIRASRFGRGVVQVVVELSRPTPVQVTSSSDRAAIVVDVPAGANAQARSTLTQPAASASIQSAAPQVSASVGPEAPPQPSSDLGKVASAPTQSAAPQVSASVGPVAPPQPTPGPGKVAAAPAVRPEGTVYLLGPEDVLEVSVWGYPDLTRIVPVRPDGQIAVPLAGTVPAAGRSVERLTQDLTRAFAKYIIKPQVAVIVKEFRKIRASILGQVAHPGAYILAPGARVLDVISMAAGVSDDAALTQAQLVRASGETRPLNLDGLLVQQDMRQNLAVESGDTIIIPQDTKSKFYVLGDVNRPGIYPLKGDVTVLEALATAGGPVMHGTSSSSSVNIVRRRGPDDGPLTASVHQNDVQPIANGSGVLISKDLRKMYRGDLQQNETLRPGDLVVVPAPGMAALPTILSIIGMFFGIRP